MQRKAVRVWVNKKVVGLYWKPNVNVSSQTLILENNLEDQHILLLEEATQQKVEYMDWPLSFLHRTSTQVVGVQEDY